MKERLVTPNGDADFTPAQSPFVEVSPFRVWMQQALPLYYSEHLSTYELMCKLFEIVNTVIDNTDNMHTDVTALHDAYVKLQKYVNDYFKSLDVQEEINNKLDGLVQDGTLSNLLAVIVGNKMYPQFVGTIAEMTDKSKVYVLETDGHIYQWNGNDWTDTGVTYGEFPGLLQVRSPGTVHDFNNYILNGTYFLTTTYDYAHAPISNNKIGGVLLVSILNGGIRNHIFFSLDGYVYYRFGYANGAWENWKSRTLKTLDVPGVTDMNDILINSVYYGDMTALNPDNSFTSLAGSATKGTLFTIESNGLILQFFLSYDARSWLARERRIGYWTGWKSIPPKFFPRQPVGALDMNTVITNASYYIPSPVPSNITNLPTDKGFGLVLVFPLGGLYMQVFFTSQSGLLYRYRFTGEGSQWTKWSNSDQYAFRTITSEEAISYGSALTNIPANYGFISEANIWADAPSSIGNVFIETFSDGNGKLKFQKATYLNSGAQWIRGYDGTVWSPWKVGESDKRFSTQNVICFGDSTTYGQGDGGKSPFNYPASISKAFNIEVINKGAGGQGLIKDNTNILNTINNTDFSNTKLVTVAWAYNDLSLYPDHNYGTSIAPAEDSVLWYYYNIMSTLQAKNKKMKVALITGFGAATEQGIVTWLDALYTFKDAAKTVREFYNDLAAMCEYYGWNCINQARHFWINKETWPSLIRDNIHPNNDGYKAYSDFICAQLGTFFYNLDL